MTQRTITGALLAVLLLMALYFGGWVFAILWVGSVCIALFEMFRALSAKGHRPISWPTWVALIVSIPCFLLITKTQSVVLLITTIVLACFVVGALVIFRTKPSLEDLLMSILPLFAVALPGMSLLGMLQITPVSHQRILLVLVFFIPVIGDTFAYFGGVKFGKTKLSPIVSPKKTVEGAVIGLAGSVLTALAIYLVSLPLVPGLPKVWHFLFIGLFAGIAGQLGDLFASLVKRHCEVKDFGKLFPGHGGMMDRLDSVLFVSVTVYLYQLLFWQRFLG